MAGEIRDIGTDYRTNQKIDFITDSPAIEAFHKSSKFQQDTQLNEQRIADNDLNYRDKVDTRGSRLRKAQADSDISVTNADIAARTADNKVTMSNVDAQYAEPKARAGLRSVEANTAATKLATGKRVLEYLEQGDEATAQELARQAGLPPIAPQLVQNRALIGQMLTIAKRAPDLYDDPKKQQAWVDGQMAVLKERASRGATPDPTQPYQMPAGSPAPDATGRASSSGRDPAEVATMKFLRERGVAADDTQAWQMVRSARDNPAQTKATIFNNALRSTFGNEQKAREITERAMQEIFGAPNSAARPAPAAAQRPDMMTPGNGNKPQNIPVPPRPPTVPNGSAYSPSRQQWRGPDGRVYDGNGQPAQ